MSTLVSTQETFIVGECVFFRNPTGEYAATLKQYITAVGEQGPFTVLAVKTSRNPRAHHQIVRLGRLTGKPIMVSFGGGKPEPFEVSGFWLTRNIC